MGGEGGKRKNVNKEQSPPAFTVGYYCTSSFGMGFSCLSHLQHSKIMYATLMVTGWIYDWRS